MALTIFIPLIAILFAVGIAYSVIYSLRISQKGRRSPLTRQLLRPPGESLRRQIEDRSLDGIFYFMMLMLIPLLTYSVYTSQKIAGAKLYPLFYWILAFLLMALFAFKFMRLLRLRHSLRLGLDCELAVGQELNQLMLDGYRVFHDFPAEKFNIDHVVVGPKGIFAVETKGRAKPDKNRGTEDATVIFDGQCLKFPGWREKEPIEQAKRQAMWLAKWLSSAVGEDVKVTPVLAIPGWYVKREKPSDIFIFNGTNPQILIKYGKYFMSDSLVKRLVHQLDQRCRTVQPTAYSK